ncbi:acyltransferase [Novosphingobium sp. TH158]|uniref:acyltransferase family protein n=1 Tax=Novosphingobium sp. TH158 TaxID=2067455 RepID=UPI0013041FBC|nr:acyltransferase [Novosphingobium sp. TH158]
MDTSTGRDRQAAGGRLAALDGLRGLAALGVAVHHVFYHYAPFGFDAGPLKAAADWLWHSGWTMVDLFFVLSGFVFAHVYLPGGTLQSWRGQQDFWVARLARLWPLHLFMLGICALVLADNPANTPWAFVAHLAMMQGFVDPVAHTFNYASWSLTIEVVCYMIFAACAAAGPEWTRRAAMLLVALATAYFIILGSPGGPWVEDVLWRGLLGFFLGQILWSAREKLAQVPAVLLIALIIAGFWLQAGDHSPLVPLTLLAWPAALLLALRSKAMASRPMVWLGDRSYAIYLVNLPIILVMHRMVDPAHMSAAGLLAMQAGLVLLVLAASEASFRWLEVPARNALRRAWAGRARTGPHPAFIGK